MQLPNHERQRCPFRLKDLQHNIDQITHPQKGNMGNTDINNYIPKSNKGNKSPMSIRLVNETGNSGYPRFWQTQCGYIIYSIDNQPQCSYCGIPAHGRDTCRRRRNHESKGEFRIHHPQRGLLQQTKSTQPNSSCDNIAESSNPKTGNICTIRQVIPCAIIVENQITSEVYVTPGSRTY